jgi:hypothetical protein
VVGDRRAHRGGARDEGAHLLHASGELDLLQRGVVVRIGGDHGEHEGFVVEEHREDAVQIGRLHGHALEHARIDHGLGELLGGDEARRVDGGDELEEVGLAHQLEIDQRLLDAHLSPCRRLRSTTRARGATPAGGGTRGRPVPAGMRRPMMTFSLRPRRSSVLPQIAASVSTLVVSWKDEALMKESVERLAFVMPRSSGSATAGGRRARGRARSRLEEVLLDLLVDEEVRVADVLDAHAAQHLADDRPRCACR